jgi:hypothetical protein
MKKAAYQGKKHKLKKGSRGSYAYHGVMTCKVIKNILKEDLHDVDKASSNLDIVYMGHK